MDRGRATVLGDGPQFPSTIAIGDFTLDVESIAKQGRWVEARKEFQGVAGTEIRQQREAIDRINNFIRVSQQAR